MNQIAGAGGATFLVTFLAIVALRPLAYAVHLVDRPGGHKTHHGGVPLMGGLAMFLGIVFGLSLAIGGSREFSHLLLAGTLLVVVGMLDDRFNLSPWIRMIVQFGATLPIILGTDMLVTSLGDPFGLGEIELGIWAAPFTSLLIMSAINAFNMLDGMDGLAGGVALVTFLVLAGVAAFAGQPGIFAHSMIMIGAVSAFLIFNAPLYFNQHMRCFMGDAGSTILGFFVALVCIELTQDPASVLPPVTVLWLIAWPLFELLWSTTRRIIAGRSPFRADNQHFHHVLTRNGFGVRSIFVISISVSPLFAVTGLLMNRIGAPEWVSLASLLLLGPGIVYLVNHSTMFLRLVPPAYRRKASTPRGRVLRDSGGS